MYQKYRCMKSTRNIIVREPEENQNHSIFSIACVKFYSVDGSLVEFRQIVRVPTTLWFNVLFLLYLLPLLNVQNDPDGPQSLRPAQRSCHHTMCSGRVEQQSLKEKHFTFSAAGQTFKASVTQWTRASQSLVVALLKKLSFRDQNTCLFILHRTRILSFYFTFTNSSSFLVLASYFFYPNW